MDRSNLSFLLFVPLVLLASCTGGRSVKSSNRNYILQASHDTAILDGVLTVNKLFIVDSCLAVLSQQEPYFNFYDLDNYQPISRFGLKGRAYGEYLSEPKGVNYVDNAFQCYDHSLKALLLVSPKDGSMQKMSIPYEFDFRPVNAVLINDKVVSAGCFGSGIIGYVNGDGSYHFCNEDYPFDTSEITGVQRGVYFQSEITAAPTRNRFILRLYASDCFGIYEVMDHSVEKIFLNDFTSVPVVEGSRINLKKSKAGYIRSYVDDDYVYLMKSSESYQEVSGRGLVSNMIDVFNWDGGYVGTLTLDVEVGAFCVNNHYLYAAKECDSGSTVVRIDISGLMSTL